MADERTYKMLLGAIAGGGSGGLPDYSEANDGDVLSIEDGEPAWAAPGGASGLCVLTDGTLNKSYNDLVAMVNGGIIPFIYHSGYLYFLGALDISGDGIAFVENSQSGTNLLFYAPDADPDANLLLD